MTQKEEQLEDDIVNLKIAVGYLHKYISEGLNEPEGIMLKKTVEQLLKEKNEKRLA